MAETTMMATMPWKVVVAVVVLVMVIPAVAGVVVGEGVVEVVEAGVTVVGGVAGEEGECSSPGGRSAKRSRRRGEPHLHWGALSAQWSR